MVYGYRIIGREYYSEWRFESLGEAKEELGIEIDNVEVIGHGVAVNPPDIPEPSHYLFYTVLCTKKLERDIIVLNEEATEYFWVKVSDLEDYGLKGIWEKPLEHIRNKMLENIT